MDIVSNAVTPESIDPKQVQDKRVLGVAVRGVTLLREGFSVSTPPADGSVLSVFPPGKTSVAGVEQSGVYDEEHDRYGPFVWTNGNARLVIPVKKGDPPQALQVQLDRPPDRYLKITVDNREVFNEPAVPNALRRWERTFGLSDTDLGESLVLEIASNSTVPRSDNRPLGVQIRGVNLLSGDRGEKRPVDTVTPAKPID